MVGQLGKECLKTLALNDFLNIVFVCFLKNHEHGIVALSYKNNIVPLEKQTHKREKMCNNPITQR